MGLFNFMKKDKPNQNNNAAANVGREEALKTIDLRKKTVKICLEKKNIIDKARVGVVIDKSTSMEGLYKKNVVQDVTERILPIALNMDDNGELDTWIFANQCKRLTSVSIENFHGYVNREILKKNTWWGSTEYAPVMRDIINKYIEEEPMTNVPTLILFFTDGENDLRDKPITKKLIKDAAKYNIFWQFIGIGRARFEFLDQLDNLSGRIVDNANFFKIDDITKISDSELYDKLLNEYPIWLKAAKEKKILK